MFAVIEPQISYLRIKDFTRINETKHIKLGDDFESKRLLRHLTKAFLTKFER